jgi:hypothetical protein
METKLFIPKTIRVGYQERPDTFTGKLAYVIYYDEKGKLRKESSWNSWCESELGHIDIENTPKPNFVLNKGVKRYGGWGSNSGRNMVRIYDPRDFEFEITVENLLGVLAHSDVTKRDIVEECVYAWAGSELVLLPVNSDAYQQSLLYTEKQEKGVSAKELIKGHTYTLRKSDGELIYIGHFKYFEVGSYRRDAFQHDKGKKHIFFDGKHYVTPGVATLAEDISNEPVANYANLVEAFLSSTSGNRISGIYHRISDTIKAGQQYVIPTSNPDRFMTVFQSAEPDSSGNPRVLNFVTNSSRYHYGSLHQFARYITARMDGNDFYKKEHYYSSWDNENPFYTPERVETYGHYSQYKTDKVIPAKKSPEYIKFADFFESKGYDLTAITTEQVVEAMKHIGFGKMVYVFADGKEKEIDYI